jgi:hypothetical protein
VTDKKTEFPKFFPSRFFKTLLQFLETETPLKFKMAALNQSTPLLPQGEGWDEENPINLPSPCLSQRERGQGQKAVLHWV